ncbi:hypothetical protein BJ875DRAFT_473224 [Amylocarpus encephaloides]|uniref:DUF1308 domain-containing protein n=1 Tax=Amylocarpus encephaloides TaxID=45428 RepID=A0A9P7YBA7_9HELO|nr:hypothetical protein BJ875DRAFT_473224 [Amylocarpus encephaloides]
MDTNSAHPEKGETAHLHQDLEGKITELNVADAVIEVESEERDTEDGSVTEVGPEVDAQGLASEMQERCRTLLSELEEFSQYLKAQRKENTVELRTFRNGLQSEMKLIDKLAKKDTPNETTVHSLRSSNFLFYASVWSTAKACNGLTALSRRFYWDPNQAMPNINGEISTRGTKHRTWSAVADVVCQNGLEWVKVSSNTEKRIIWDLAKAGWVGDSESEDFEDDDYDDPQGILRQVESLVKAAKATRVRYRHPSIRLVLPRISRTPKAKEVDMVIQKIRNLGVTVQTAEDMAEELPLSDRLHKLVADRIETFSEVLNIDCTVLLAFASDLSHGRVEPEDWHNKMIQRQRKMEAEEQLLPCSLWPACKNKKMVCTREAAVRMQEIVNTIGTINEKERTDLLMNLNTDARLTTAQRLEEFQKLSDYTIPPDWQLPIEVIDVSVPGMLKQLPPVAEKIAESLSEINRSVTLYGWQSGQTTISSNRAVAKEVESMIEESRESDEIGPDIWLCSTTRSLVGKEKERRGGVKEKTGESESS